MIPLIWWSYCCSSLILFRISTVTSAFFLWILSSATVFSWRAATRSVWKETQRRWRSFPSSPFRANSFWRLWMVASRGPMFSSVWLAVRRSNCLLRMSTCLVFFSISSLRRRISTSYFSIELSFSSISRSRSCWGEEREGRRKENEQADEKGVWCLQGNRTGLRR